jgi:phosphoribosylformylglycinamidine cyclo-ligase
MDAAERALYNVKDVLGNNAELYAGIFSLGDFVKGMKDPVLAAGTDGVGTKLELLKDKKRWDVVARDLVAMNLNDLVCVGAKPLFFLDYYSTDLLNPDDLSSFIRELAIVLKSVDCKLIGGETAELNGIFANGKTDVAGFAVGIVDRSSILSKERVKNGDVLIALKSSGPHSNGFTLIRKLLETGKMEMNEDLIKPTKLYVKQTLKIRDKIKAAAHITGGGIPGNLKRIIPRELSAQIEINIELPFVFKKILDAGVKIEEAFRVFNMGIGMIYVTSPENEKVVCELLRSEGEDPLIIGNIVPENGKKIRIRFNGKEI